MPDGPAMIWWVALPVTDSALSSKARRALRLAISMAITTDTPRAMPRTISTLCQGRRKR